jgi:hypothetical protein
MSVERATRRGDRRDEPRDAPCDQPRERFEPTPWTRQPVSRRRFLQVAAAAAILAACESRPKPSLVPTLLPPSPEPSAPGSPGPTDELPFSVWRQLRDAVRTSPDHLAARAEDLVAARDPEAIIRFVAQEIETLPGQDGGFGNAETAARWGTRATLRCGAGTPREKADLLAELLEAAGFEAAVASAELRAGLGDRPDLLSASIGRRFAPEVDDATLDAWRGLLGLTGATAPLAMLDPDGTDSRILGGSLLPLLGAPRAGAFGRRITSRVPVVSVTIGAAPRIVNPLFPDEPDGSTTINGTPVVPLPATPSQTLNVEVLVARSDDPNNRIVVAEAAWSADDLVGRMIQVGFAPVGGHVGLAGRSIEEVTLFTPVLAVRGPDLDSAAVLELAAAGKTISSGGRILEDRPDGTPVVDGQPLAATPSNPTGAASVAALDGSARADAFPTVRLTLSPLDAAGKVVSGLGAADLRVEEDGRPAAFVLIGNQPRPPRVLLLFDSSRSIPAEFRAREASGLGRQLAEGVGAAHPGAEFLVAGVNYGTVTPAGDWTTDPAVVEANVANVPGEGSDLWMALGEATTLGASVVVLISDGDATDPPEEVARSRPRLGGGPPVVIVGVGGTATPATGAWVTLTGGAFIPATQVAEAVAGVASALSLLQASPFRLEYVTRREGPATRTVRISVGGSRADLEYVVPAPADQLPAPALAGLYLRFRLSGQGEVMRTLAGLDHREPHRRGDLVPQALTDEVLGMLFGGALIAVEAGTPTLSAWLDGFLAAKLSFAPLWAAARANDVSGMLDAVVEATPLPPALLQPLTGALPGNATAAGLTFPAGLRCVLYTERPVFGAGTRRAVDVLPTAGWVTAADDREDAFVRTLERTARLAVAERALFETSTASALAGRALERLPAGQVAPRDGPLAPYARALDEYSAYDRLVPTDTGPFAFWAVRPTTGELLGILHDGSGGGSGTDGAHIIDKTAAALGLAASFAGLGFAVGAFISLQKAIAKVTLVLAAWILTIGDENPPPDPDLSKNVKDLACDLAKDTLGAASHAYEAIDKLDKVGEIGGKPLVPCP